MTLILTFASLRQRYVLQVSDRLTTRGTVPYDSQSNKSLLYVARNGVVAISYTGIAYLDGTPTDQWLAEKIFGEKFLLRDGHVPVGRMGRAPQWLDIGQMLQVLKLKLDAAFTQLGPRDREIASYDISLGGWQWNRKYLRPLMASISYEKSTGTFSVWQAPRYFCYPDEPTGRAHCGITVAPDANVTQLERRELTRALSSAESPDLVEKIMVECIRTVSSRLPLVGPNCMSIMIPMPSVGPARIRYIPQRFQMGTLRRDDGNSTSIPVSFSPWVIGRDFVGAPSILGGGGHITHLGPVEVIIEGAANAPRDSHLIIEESQPRRPAP